MTTIRKVATVGSIDRASNEAEEYKSADLREKIIFFFQTLRTEPDKSAREIFEMPTRSRDGKRKEMVEGA